MHLLCVLLDVYLGRRHTGARGRQQRRVENVVLEEVVGVDLGLDGTHPLEATLAGTRCEEGVVGGRRVLQVGGSRAGQGVQVLDTPKAGRTALS